MEPSNCNKPSPGVACIKTHFLQKDRVRELNLDFVADKDKKRGALIDHDIKEFLPPKKKLKGQNKRRPRNKNTPRSERLCFKIGAQGSCPFGNTCSYSHDVDAYLATKPPDIDSTCYLYRTFGKCPYSYSCRFGSDHIKDGQNLVLEEVYEMYKDKKTVVNFLIKELQQSLWKHRYNFQKTDKVIEIYSLSLNRNTGDKQNTDTYVSRYLQKLESEEQKNNMPVTPTEEQKSNLPVITTEEQKSNFPVIPTEEPKSILTVIPIEQNIGDAIMETNETSKMLSERETIEIEKKADMFAKPIEECTSTFESCEKSSVVANTVIPIHPIKKDVITDLPCTNLENINTLDDLLFETEVKQINFKDKLYLAPLTTVGNLPFRRICKEFGADITCSEMALSLSLLQGQKSEWALIKRHHTEDIFGIQICGFNQPKMTRCCQLLSENASFDFIDINMGCPLDAIYKQGAGCGLMNKIKKLEGLIYCVSSVISVPLTLKMRTGIYANTHLAHTVIEKIKTLKNHVSLITIHGRCKDQRYTKSADWDYIDKCSKIADPIPLFGNGDILSYEDYNMRRKETGVSGIMIARGALIKPWIFKEIKDQTHWDISSAERLDILKSYANYGLEHWGSDTQGVEKTRRFLLEWLSFLYRYIPVGLLERPPQRINERPPPYFGRNDLETLMASPSCSDWIKISEMLLGPVPEDFEFLPKHKANAYK